MKDKIKPLENVTIIGTGTRSTLIALLAAHNGYKVKLYDSNENSFKQTVDKFCREAKSKNIDVFIPLDGWDKA